MLVLLSWILPVTTLIVAGFLFSLFWTGLEALWNTRHATSLMLVTAALLVLLINAAFQNGGAGREIAAPGILLAEDAKGDWIMLGQLYGNIGICAELIWNLREHAFQSAAPLYKDLLIGGQRFPLLRPESGSQPKCGVTAR